MSWNRQAVADALVTMLTAATEGAVKVHERPPETINPPAIVIGRPQPVLYSAIALSIDDASLPVIIAVGIESEDQAETIKTTVRNAVMGDPTLGGTVQSAVPSEERNWRNFTGAGGIQILTVELILSIQM